MQVTREIFMKPWRFSLPLIIVVWHRRNLIEFQRKNSKTLTNIYCSDYLQFLRSDSFTDRGKFEALSAFKIKITKTKRNFTEVLQKRCKGSSRAQGREVVDLSWSLGKNYEWSHLGWMTVWQTPFKKISLMTPHNRHSLKISFMSLHLYFNSCFINASHHSV